MSALELRCILLMGGHAAGKTTLEHWGRDRVGTMPGYVWHCEGGNGGRASLSTMPVEEAYALGMQQWLDRSIHTLVVEGTRVYGTIFRCAHQAANLRSYPNVPERALWVLQLLQTPDVGRAHLQARCAANGKEYRADYWEKDEAEYQFAERHVAALRKFLPRSRGPNEAPNAWDPPLGEQLTIWVELGHGNLGPAYTWFANALRVPIIPRTPVRLPEHRPVRTPVRYEEVTR